MSESPQETCFNASRFHEFKKESLFLSVYLTVWMLHEANTARLVITLYHHITGKLPTPYRHITNCRPTVGRLIVCVLEKTCRPTDGQQSANRRPTVGQQVFWGALLHNYPNLSQQHPTWRNTIGHKHGHTYTMLGDKLKKSVAPITGPPFTCDAVKGNITYNMVDFWPKISITYKQQLVSLIIEK